MVSVVRWICQVVRQAKCSEYRPNQAGHKAGISSSLVLEDPSAYRLEIISTVKKSYRLTAPLKEGLVKHPYLFSP